MTLGVLLARKIRFQVAAWYMIAQTLGAIAGAGLLLVIAKGAATGYHPAVAGLGANGYGAHSPEGYSLLAAFAVEVILTFLLVLTVLGSTDIKAPVGFAGIAIGLVLVLIHLVGIPVTNTSVNPARSIGPAIFVGGWALSQLWLFIIAPFIGAALAAAAYSAVRTPDTLLSTTDAERSLVTEQALRTEQSVLHRGESLKA